MYTHYITLHKEIHMAQPFNLRLEEETVEKFRNFCKENDVTNAQAFDLMLSALEIEQAKTKVGPRAKEIEQYQMHIKALLNSFVNSIEMNETAEERIRGEFRRQLETKDKIIEEFTNKIRITEENAEKAKQNALKVQEDSKNEVERIRKECEDKIAEKSELLAASQTEKKNMLDELNKVYERAQKTDEIVSLLREKEEKTKDYDQIKSEFLELKEYCKNLEKELNDTVRDKELELAKQTLQYEQEKGKIQKEYFEKIMEAQNEINQLKLNQKKGL